MRSRSWLELVGCFPATAKVEIKKFNFRIALQTALIINLNGFQIVKNF